jgi:NAD(P)-dependent dehydrogenase (short-subunit alcohol dehydrogenase family)
MNRFEGQVSWVTGGASGLGRATALRFAAEGSKVVISDLNQESSDETVELIEQAGGTALSAPCDVTDLSTCVDAVAAIEESYGRLDNVFASAGMVGAGGVEMIREEDFYVVVDVNLNGVFRTAKAALPAMRRSGGGAMVFASSIEGLAGNAMLPAYSTAKTALVGLCRSLAEEGAPDIRVNCIHPGYIETPMTEPIAAMMPDFKTDWANKAPMGRVGTPDDVVGVVLFLCSDDARFVTGDGISVDGGTMAVRS